MQSSPDSKSTDSKILSIGFLGDSFLATINFIKHSIHHVTLSQMIPKSCPTGPLVEVILIKFTLTIIKNTIYKSNPIGCINIQVITIYVINTFTQHFEDN